VKRKNAGQNIQKRFNFSSPQPRPFLAGLPAKIDTYEEGVARFFRWKTGLDYYLTIDQIVDWVVNTQRSKVIDLLTDTATFALRLAGLKAFPGRIFSFDNNVTLLERAKQRAVHLNLQPCIEFRYLQEPKFPIPDGFGEVAVSIFDLHRHPAEQYLTEAFRILAREGHLILTEWLEPKSAKYSFSGIWKKMHLQYIQRNPVEAHAVYHDREEIIQLLFEIGFRQITIWVLSVPASGNSGAFSLIDATK
jgi:ubiquinone/menaquinone biosynthesis C-methylase UbiE